MKSNYFATSALRNARRYPKTAISALTSLTLGFTCSIALLFYAKYELTFDKEFTDQGDIYQTQVLFNEKFYQPVPSISWAKNISDANLESIDKISVIQHNPHQQITIDHNNTRGSVIFSDENFFKIFPRPVLTGDSILKLQSNEFVILTEGGAKLFFGDINCIGNTLSLEGKPFIVSSVIKDYPKNSHLSKLDIKAFAHTSKWPDSLSIMEDRPSAVYIRQKPGYSSSPLESLLNADFRSSQFFNGKNHLHLTSLSEARLTQTPRLTISNSTEGGSYIVIYGKEIVYTSIFLAAIILLASCINFINLILTQNTWRKKEFMMRRIFGASKRKLFNQIFVDALATSAIAAIIAASLTQPLLAIISATSEVDIQADWSEPSIWWLSLPVIVLCVALISSLLPFLSLCQQLNSSDGKPKEKSYGKLLSTVQFIASSIFLITAIFAYQNLYKFQNIDIGYNDRDLAILQIPFGNQSRSSAISLQKELVHRINMDGKAKAILSGTPILTDTLATLEVRPHGETEQPYKITDAGQVEPGFFEFHEIPIISGREFKDELTHEAVSRFQLNLATKEKTSSGAVILTKNFAKSLGFSSPDEAVGKILDIRLTANNSAPTINTAPQRGEANTNDLSSVKVIGVVDNYLSGTTVNKNDFGILAWPNRPHFTVAIRLPSSETHPNMRDKLSYIESILKEVSASAEMNLLNVKHELEKSLLPLKTIGNSLIISSLITLTIALLGIYAASTHDVLIRLREICIRKLLGSPASSIIKIIIFDQMKHIIFAAALSIPIGYIIIEKIKQFTPINLTLDWLPFAITVLIILATAIFTIIDHAWRAARSDPRVVLQNSS